VIVTLLIVFLVLFLAFAYPSWQARSTWGAYPVGVIVLALVILLIMYLLGVR